MNDIQKVNGKATLKVGWRVDDIDDWRRDSLQELSHSAHDNHAIEQDS